MSADACIRIMLVDDHQMVRLGLATVIELSGDMRVVAEAEDGPRAVEEFRRHRPDVVLMDLRMPGMSGIEATRAIRGEFPEVRVMMLTTYDFDEDIHRALEAGACGYVLKDARRHEVLAAIRRVHAGERYLPTAVATRLAERAGDDELTAREIEVLELIAKGLSDKEIAATLAFTLHTAKAHVKSILRKLGVSARTEAATLALQRGILHLD